MYYIRLSVYDLVMVSTPSILVIIRTVLVATSMVSEKMEEMHVTVYFCLTSDTNMTVIS